jgi:HEAT repeat protein
MKAEVDLSDPAQLMAFLIATFTPDGTKLGAEDLDFLFEALAAQEDWGLRNLLFTHLERIGGESVTNGVLGFLATEQDPAAFARALRTLGALKDDAAVAGLVEVMATSQNRRLRDAAFKNLLAAKNPAATGPLLDALARSTDPSLRRYALAALTQVGGAEGAAVVVQYATSSDPVEKALGLKSLRDIRDPASVGVLTDALARSTDPGFRSQAIRTISQTRSSEGVQPLAHVALQDPNRGLRMAAISGLARIGSPEAIPALSTIAAQGDRGTARAAERAIQSIERQEEKRRRRAERRR